MYNHNITESPNSLLIPGYFQHNCQALQVRLYMLQMIYVDSRYFTKPAVHENTGNYTLLKNKHTYSKFIDFS